ncbi:ATP-binding protein [Aquiflexum sp.]|uniref:sensor histidine kinase n=1 Tax=Aquiflexum sp. TaxID=1872584 RepID=UPI0035935FBB
MGNQFVEFIQNLFDTSDFPARWNCGKWSDFHGWFYIIGDLMVWSAYFTIPVIILGYVYKRKDVRFHRIYFLFAAFILSCGATHLLDAAIFWIPLYRLSALSLFITGVVSWTTVFYLIKLAPQALSLKTAEDLEAEVDIRIKAEKELKIKLRQLNEAQALARMGSWEWEVAPNKLSWSDEMFNVYDLSVSSEGLSFEDFLGYVHQEDREFVGDTIQQALMEKKFPDFFHRIVTPKGNVKTLHAKGSIILDSEGEIVKMIGTGQDVTHQKQAEQALVYKSRELQEVNKELQKFAYVASHDLQEPLRKIKTFISLLEPRMTSIYDDDKCHGYLKKIDAAASRMQSLMQDILNFSRISSATVEFENLDLNLVVDDVLIDMEISILSSQARITVQPLPEITGNKSQWIQLFQNLISNAIKYAKPGSGPLIDISSKIVNGDSLPSSSSLKSHYKFKEWDDNYYWAREKFCSISVRDQGIGIEPEYYTKIFEAFQRLHTLNEYEGTGIGLAICKKIVDYHHGIIYVNSTKDGTIFTIVVPVSQDNFEVIQQNQGF